MKSFVFIILCIHIIQIQCKTYTKCELARELRRLGFPRHELRDWVCLAFAESSFRANVIGPMNSDQSHDFGIFQINDRYWCTYGYPGKGCKMDCRSLLTNDIRASARCARTIYNESGFRAWYGWINECQNRLLPTVAECF